MENNTSESSLHYRTMCGYFFENSSSGMLVCEPVYHDEVMIDLHILHANKSFEQLIGIEQVAGKNMNKVMPDFAATNKPIMQMFEDVCTKGISQKLEIFASKLNCWLNIEILTPDRRVFIASITDVTARKLNENSLLEIQTKYNSLLHSDTVGIGIALGERAIFANATLQQIFEYTEDELKAMTYSQLYHPEDRIILAERMRKRKNGEEIPANVVVRIFTKSGKMKYVQHTTTHFTIDGILMVQSIVIDVTDKFEAERELRISEERFRILFEQAAVGVAQLNSNTGQFVRVNNKYLEIMGYTREEMLQLNYMQITVPEDLDSDLGNMDKLKQGEITEFSMEKRLIHKSGHSIWVSLNVSSMWKPGEKPDYHIAVVADITKQKLNEMERRKLRVAVEQSPVTIAITNLNGEIEYVNPAFCKTTGYTIEEVMGQNPRVLNSGKTPPEVFQDLWQTINAGKTWIGEFINRKKNGALYYEEAIISPVFDENNKIVNYLAIKNDISYKKLQEELIKKNNRQLTELNATKDKFFSIIAHDLKNPFNSILGFSELLINHLDEYSQEKIYSFVKTINDSAQNAYKLLENLLDWARSQLGRMEFRPEQIIVENLFLETSTLMHTTCIAKNIILTYEIHDSIIIIADKEMISSVLRNLVSNAIKYTKPYGSIHLKAVKNDTDVVFSIKDTGIGIPVSKIDLLFKISEKVSSPGTNNESGTGLGLILCKEFVERHNGKIWVDKTGEYGTTFKFSIPLVNQYENVLNI